MQAKDLSAAGRTSVRVCVIGRFDGVKEELEARLAVLYVAYFGTVSGLIRCIYSVRIAIGTKYSRW